MTCLVTQVDNSWHWYKRFCHINFDNIVNESSTFVVIDFPKIVKHTNIVCKECMMAKRKMISFPRKEFSTFS